MALSTPRGDPYADPVLHLGVDIGYARDTLGLAAIFHQPAPQGEGWFGLWGHRIWAPDRARKKQVRINQTIVPMLHWLLDHCRVGQILYDPFQFKSEAQRLEDAGYGRLLTEVNQSSQSVMFSNILHSHINNGRFFGYKDKDVRSHFSWANAQETERGWRIVKMKQSRPIDAVIAIAMGLMGATQDDGSAQHPSYSGTRRTTSLLEIP